MRYTLLFFVILMWVITPLIAQSDLVLEKFDFQQFEIGDFNPVRHLPPLNQDTTSSCWSFATLSFIESEMVREGKKPVKLAVMYPVYYAFIEKASQFVATKGESRFAPGDLFPTVVEIIEKYGIVPQEIYTGRVKTAETYNHDLLYEELENFMRKIKGDSIWEEETVLTGVKKILDKRMGQPPDQFIYENREYTPSSFRDERVGLKWDQYISITSFSHAPFDSLIVLDVPDNWKKQKVYYNLPLHKFYKVLVKALENGYSAAIDCDISTPGRVGREDISVIPEYDIPGNLISQAARDYRFKDGGTTDDHLMHVLGMYTDGEQTWFLVKDSWRDAWEGRLKGYFIFHSDYVRLKVLAYMVHRVALALN